MSSPAIDPFYNTRVWIRRELLLPPLALAFLGVLASYAHNSLPRHGSLAWLAREAQSRGSNEYLTGVDEDTEEGSNVFVFSFDQALRSSSIVVATVVEERPLVISEGPRGGDNIFTWYRLRVDEWLKKQSTSALRFHGFAFAQWLRPRAPDEIVIVKTGGTVMYDGVLIKQRRTREFAEFLARPYLFFANLDSANHIGTVELGPNGMFLVDGDRLRPFALRDQNLVTTTMATRFHNSLTEFRRFVNTK